MTEPSPDRLLRIEHSLDEGEMLYTITVDPTGEPLLGIIVEGDTARLIHWPDGEQNEVIAELPIPLSDEARLEAAYTRALEAVPNEVELVYVSQGDQLSDKQIQAAFRGAAPYDDPHFDEWESEARYSGTWGTLEYHVDSEDLDLLQKDTERFEDLFQAVQERDTSDPFMRLARMTPHKWMRYVANWDAEPWPYDNVDDDIAGIADQLGIDPVANDALLRELVTEANGGGVYVLWYGGVDELIEAAQRFDNEGNQLPQTITWENPHLLVLDCMSGSGQMVSYTGTITLPFDRNRLLLDVRGVGNGYSWSDEVAGLAGDRGTTTVTIKAKDTAND